MKKIAFLNAMLLTLISSVFGQDSMDFSASATYGYESEFVFRGFHISEDTFTPSAEGRFLNENMTIYMGVRTALPTQKTDNKTKMHEYYLGGEFALSEIVSLDVGLSHYEFLPFTDDSSLEGSLGVSFDTFLSPSLYIYADTDGDMTTYEFACGHTFPLDQKSGVTLSAFAGDSEFYVGSTYFGAMLDYSYNFTRYARFSIGARFSKLDPDGEVNPDFVADTDDTVGWYGVSFTSGF